MANLLLKHLLLSYLWQVNIKVLSQQILLCDELLVRLTKG